MLHRSLVQQTRATRYRRGVREISGGLGKFDEAHAAREISHRRKTHSGNAGGHSYIKMYLGFEKRDIDPTLSLVFSFAPLKVCLHLERDTLSLPADTITRLINTINVFS